MARSLQQLSGELALQMGRDGALARWAETWGATLIADISQRFIGVGRLLTIRIFLQQGLMSAMVMVRELEAVTNTKAKAWIVEVMKKHARPMLFNSWLSEGAALFDTTADIQDHAVKRSLEYRPGEDQTVDGDQHVN